MVRIPIRCSAGVARIALTAALTIAACAAHAAGVVPLGTATYTENFDSLATTGTSSTTPDGWYLGETGSNANATYTAGTGSSNAGDTYSFGSVGSTERALGLLQSGSVVPTVGVQLTNNTGQPITSLTVGFTGEQWRLGTAARPDRLDFQYSVDATSLATGTWTDFNALDFNAPTSTGSVGALDGNASANRTAITATITGLNVAPGATFWLRWTDFNASGADDALAVDDVSITAGTVPAENLPITTGAAPAGINTAPGIAASSALSARDLDSIVNGASITSASVPGISLDGFVPAAADGGTATATLSVAGSVPVGTYSVQVTFTNNEGQSALLTVQVAVTAATRIHDIQGAAHLSPMNGMVVGAVPGVVTVVRNNGFWMEDWQPDANPATSEGIFVFTNTAPAVTVGQTVLVSGTVTEFRPGNDPTSLTITEIVAPTITSSPSAQMLPPPIIIGNGGRVPPAQAISTDAGNVETGGTFNPATEGIDFYESLEGMRVRIDGAVVVGPTNGFGEVWVVGDGGANASVRTNRGGVVIRAGDFNPERIQIDDDLLATPMPKVNVGDTAQTIVGVMSYAFGNYEVLVSTPPIFAPGTLAPEETTLVAEADRLTVASYNVENLDPADGAAKFDTLAAQIVNNLRSPDIVAAIEVQDNNGPTNDAVVDASTTLNTLVSAIAAAGGPAYQYRQINPVANQDGGEPGGNIRVAFLFNPARVGFVDRPGGTSTAANTVINAGGVPQLEFSPGRIDPTNPAFVASRKPLAAEFLFKGNRLFVIANHFNSKGGDQPLFGPSQPPTLASETQRSQQATIVAGFVQQILAVDPAAKVIVMGDLNDFEFSHPLGILKAAGLTPLVETLPPEERYTYVFEGNSQALDHIMVSGALLGGGTEYDVVHVNAEFANQASDHDPEVARLYLPRAELTSQFAIQSGGLALNRRTGQFGATVTLANGGSQPVAGPLFVVFDGLPAGVSLANAQGTVDGKPYLQIPGAVAAGTAAVLNPTFANPARVPIGYTVRVYAGPL